MSAPRSSVAAALAGATFLTALFYGLFLALAPTLHAVGGDVELSRYNTWLALVLQEHDGAELPAMLALTALVAAVAWNGARRPLALFERRAVQGVAALLAVLLVVHTSRAEFAIAAPEGLLLELAALALLAGLWALVLRAGRRWLVVLAAALTLAGWWAFDVLARAPAKAYDWGYLIAPALKLLQGERIGTFYMQYGLLQTRLVEAMLARHLLFHQMEQLFALTLPLFLLCAAWAARRLLRDRWLWLAFLVALVAVRDLGIDGDPMVSPQTLPIRLDLWVIVLLAALRWGVVSWPAALAAALVYAADNTFGLLVCAAYALAAVAVAWTQTGLTIRTVRRLVPVGLVLVAGAALQLALTGSLVSQAGQVYRSIHMGFLPIASDSLFWLVALVLVAATWFVARLEDERRREAGLLLVALTVAQLVYFFGRSHDHNLLNISGCWLLLAFLLLDALQDEGLRRVQLVAGALALLLVVGLSARASERGARAIDRLSRGAWDEQHPLDVAVGNCAGLHRMLPAGAPVFVWGLAEGYVNYRCGFAQQGYFAPFLASLDREETAAFLGGLVRDGTIVIVGSDEDARLAEPAAAAFSESRFAQDNAVRFRLVPHGVLRQLVLEPR